MKFGYLFANTERPVQERKPAEINKPIEKPEANKTMYITMVHRPTSMYFNFVRKNFSMKTVTDRETGTMTLYTKPLTLGKDRPQELKERVKFDEMPVNDEYEVGIMVTNDPTPRDSCEMVALGYSRILWLFKLAKLINRDPPTFQGWQRMFKVEILTPQREEI